ncbi:hypothetical protein [Chryseobacterium sp. YR221]|uniref:hypothetical protein n=1 Tax=Chryseobacterium sp. YR221 TaxID=1500293 RepID=UPI0009D8D47A|nr:hypothetical protein [Chryseobacterium sp. YR221]SMC90530.1 hypothetical protein SAMN02787074_3659 [Chryseobacterium sp. YR221]
MIKKLLYFLLILGLFSCQKEASFADSIILRHEKKEKLTFQKFNEGIGEEETGLIYIGKDTSTVEVKYYNTMIPAPPPPPGTEVKSNPKSYTKYFRGYFDRMKFSKTSISFDSLSENNVKIVIKPNDTIPKYTYNSETGTLKKYKAFPVFIKNISNRRLILPGLKNLPFAIFNDQQKWQMIWNDNAFICGNGWGVNYWEFEPNEIMIFSVNYLTGKDRGKFKITLFHNSSESFMMNYDKNILKKQRRYDEVK